MQTIERVIISALIRDMKAAGYEPAAVWDGELYTMAVGEVGEHRNFAGPASMYLEPPDEPEAPAEIIRPLSDAIAMSAIDSVDDCTLHFTHRNAKTWGNRGVLLILGNGEDVVSDYHVADGELFGEVVERIYQRIYYGRLP